MTMSPGIDATTIQVGERRIIGTLITLDAKGSDVVGDPGFISNADYALLQAMADAAGLATAVAYADSFGNVGTVLVRKVAGPGQFGEGYGMFALHLEAVWVTLTQRLGAAYSGG